jgi:hypothetical protein
MDYVTSESHWMEKHKVNITCLGVFFVKSILVPPEH